MISIWSATHGVPAELVADPATVVTTLVGVGPVVSDGGDGSSPASGGTIQNIAQNGIELVNTENVAVNFVTLTKVMQVTHLISLWQVFDTQQAAVNALTGEFAWAALTTT